MKLNDAVFGAIFFALSLLVLWDVRSYPKIPGQDVGPAAFPAVVAMLLAVCSLLLIVQGLRARPRQPWLELGAWLRSPAQVIAFAVTLGGLVLYVVASHAIGFLPIGIVILASLMLALRVRAPVALLVAVVATFAIHVAFYKALRVPLPWGVLPVLY
jgi:putative tricarboxylic transport membrane protein